jgi:serine/threonine protein phosphatase 1
MQNQLFKFFNRNTYGRDFVVGDLHGHFSALELMLLQIKFNPQRDRVFAVGDMIDRGPESWRVVEFLNYPWFYSVLGNHEQMLLEAASSPAVAKNWLGFNGGAWWKSVPDPYHERIRGIIAQLPVAIEIQTLSGRIGVVHADLPYGMNWQDFVRNLAVDREIREHALWSRQRFRQVQMMGRTQPIAGIDMVIFGHTPVQSPLQYSNICYIDTGATYTTEKKLGTLTLMEINPSLHIHQFCIKTQKLLLGNKKREPVKVPA